MSKLKKPFRLEMQKSEVLASYRAYYRGVRVCSPVASYYRGVRVCSPVASYRAYYHGVRFVVQLPATEPTIVESSAARTKPSRHTSYAN